MILDGVGASVIRSLQWGSSHLVGLLYKDEESF